MLLVLVVMEEKQIATRLAVEAQRDAQEQQVHKTQQLALVVVVVVAHLMYHLLEALVVLVGQVVVAVVEVVAQ
jgi:hypothetical protein